MKFFKGNQVIIYIIAFLLIAAGYLNYTDKQNESVQTSGEQNSIEVGNIGDATLVSSNEISNQSNSNIATNTNSNTDILNSTNQNENTIETNQISTKDYSSDYFATSKLDRDKMYSQMIEIYEKVLNSSSTQEAQKQVATQEIKRINDEKSKIMICENLIKTKGYNESVIFVNDNSINVVVQATELEKEKVSEIQNIVQREMGRQNENIYISTK